MRRPTLDASCGIRHVSLQGLSSVQLVGQCAQGSLQGEEKEARHCKKRIVRNRFFAERVLSGTLEKARAALICRPEWKQCEFHHRPVASGRPRGSAADLAIFNVRVKQECARAKQSANSSANSILYSVSSKIDTFCI